MVSNALPGTRDLTFGNDGLAKNTPSNLSASHAKSVAVGSDGMIVVAGNCETSQKPSGDLCVWRFLPNGLPDLSFGIVGYVRSSLDGAFASVNDIAVQKDGKIIVAGSSYGCNTTQCLLLVKFEASGSFDTSFNKVGYIAGESFVSGDIVNVTIAIQPDGKLLIAGSCRPSSTSATFCLARVDATGKLDPAFSSGTVFRVPNGANALWATNLAILPDGRFIVGGYCYLAGNLLSFFCASVHLPSGSLDLTFGGGTGIVITSIHGPIKAAPQADGRIVGAGVCGPDSAPSSAICVTRLSNSGMLDISFGSGAQVVTPMEQQNFITFAGLAVQQNSKVIVVGNCGQSGVGSRPCLARYTGTGSLDPEFGSGGRVLDGLFNYPSSVALQADGKIVVAGTCFDTRQFTQSMCVWRYEGDPVMIGATKQVTEYRYAPLDYYFITSRDSDKTALDSVASWQRTGKSFSVLANNESGSSPITRFYFDQVAKNKSRGSHFYTLLPAEVASVQALNPSNLPAPGKPVNEGIDSYAYLPSASGTCATGLLPVYRLFRGNARFPDDPNHRFTTDLADYNDFVGRGWDGEGVKFCVPQ